MILFKNTRHFFVKLVTNNTGVSSKNFAVVFGVLIAAFVIFIVVLLIWIDSVSKITIKSESIRSLSILVTAVEGIVAVLMGLKIYGEKTNAADNNTSSDNNNTKGKHDEQD